MNHFPLNKNRIITLLVGIGITFLGFFVMTLDKSEFGMGFLGITLGPILVLVGIIIPIFSLFSLRK